jgi:Transglutaminase-like superfamily
MGRGQPDRHRAVWLPATVAVAMATPLLVRLGLERLWRCLEPSRCSRPPADDPAQVVEALGRRVDRLIRWGKPLVRPGCLTRGVTGYYVLRRAGFDAALCFGIDPMRASGGAGHCWLLVDGEPVLEAMDPRLVYTEMVRLSPHGVTEASVAE